MSKKRRALPPDDLARQEAIQRHHQRRPQISKVVVGSTTFHAVSAHQLLDMDELTRQGRPGMPY